MCWTPPYTRHKTKTSKIQKHSTLYVGHHHTQDTRRRHTKQKHSTLCVGHHLTQDTRPRQAKYKNTAHYVLDTTIHKTQDEDKLNKKHNTICVGHHYTQTNIKNINKTTEHRFLERNRKYLRYERKTRVVANKKATELMVSRG